MCEDAQVAKICAVSRHRRLIVSLRHRVLAAVAIGLLAAGDVPGSCLRAREECIGSVASRHVTHVHSCPMISRLRGGAEFNPYEPAAYQEPLEQPDDQGELAPGGSHGDAAQQDVSSAAPATGVPPEWSERKEQLVRQFREAVRLLSITPAAP
jgi:hypothetical protein